MTESAARLGSLGEQTGLKGNATLGQDAASKTVQDENELFRDSEISFLQEQNRQILDALEKVEAERERSLRTLHEWEERQASLAAEEVALRERIAAVDRQLHDERTEAATKDQHLAVVADQNQSMLQLLETEEKRYKTSTAESKKLEEQNARLQKIEAEFDQVKAEITEEVNAAKQKALQLQDSVRAVRAENEALRSEVAGIEAQTQVDIESMEQALTVVRNKNVEYTRQIKLQEQKEVELQGLIQQLRETSTKLQQEINALKQQLEGDLDEREQFERDRGGMQHRLEAAESEVDAKKKALAAAQRQHEELKEDARKSAGRHREVADKVHNLLDGLRLAQVELKKSEAENGAKDKKLRNVEKQTQNFQAKIQMELEARQLAEQERKEAETESALLKKQNRNAEEKVATAQRVAAQCEQQIAKLTEKAGALQTQNAYLASRVDAQEEEKNALKAELKINTDRLSEIGRTNTKLRDEIERLRDRTAGLKEDKAQRQAELDFIKREDVLDATGRQRPILIQAAESTLLERLGINEFLYDAQQQRNPVPPLVEKIAQMLELLHTGQAQADQYLNDLSRSNTLVNALRQKNMVLFEHAQMFESFKTRAVIRYVMNLLEAHEAQSLHLDGLQFTVRELAEMLRLLQQYNSSDQVFFISLAENGLTDDAVGVILQLIYALPYLRALDLRRNQLSQEAMKRLEDSLRGVEGVTAVVRTAQHQLNAHSGNQLRLAIELGNQDAGNMPTAVRPQGKLDDAKLSHEAADTFLTSKSGVLAPERRLPALPARKPPAVKPASKRKAPPIPAVIERQPSGRVMDKWQAGNVPIEVKSRPGSGSSKPPSSRSKR